MRTILIAGCLALLATPAPAQTAPNADDYIYTNADVESLTPLPTGTPPPPRADEAADWEFVESFIARERARLDADRDHALEERRVEIEEDRPVGHGVPYSPYWVAPYGRGVRYGTPRNVAPRGGEGQDSATRVPHPMFSQRPPVREFTPGLGGSYRPKPPAASGSGR